jgi:hypothetical protein
VRRFERNRPGKGSNQEWQNPHDPDAKIGRTKRATTDLIYKPEPVVDLDIGAIVQALQQEGIRTIICDPIDNRRVDKLQAQEQRAVRGASQAERSKQIRQRITTAQRHAHRKKLRSHPGRRRHETNLLPRMGKLEQALQIGGGVLQPVATDAQTLRIWNAEAVGRPGGGPFLNFERLVVEPHRYRDEADRPTVLGDFHRTCCRAAQRHNRNSRNPGLFNRLLSGD